MNRIKNKKGFTLIELLAVILILGIIALIAIPTVNKILDESRRGAFDNTINNISKAVSNKCNLDLMKNKNMNLHYSIKNGIISPSVEIKGDIPDGDIYVNSKCEVTFYLKNSNYVAYKNEDKEKNIIKKNSEFTGLKKLPKNLSVGTPVYVNVDNGNVCMSKEYTYSKFKKEGCMQWFIYKDNNDNSYQLILDHNTKQLVAWSPTGMIDDSITGWDNTIKSTARLIEANEIAEITGNTTFNSNSATINDLFYFDSNNQNRTITEQGQSKFSWLFDYTCNCLEYGCNNMNDGAYGYWTKTIVYNNSNRAWDVDEKGRLDSEHDITVNNHNGVRPVITY